ncbi:MAG: hypothetical protein HUU10_12355 [Bacteroidetes bacterium]|nr:hypothetical protein [Bacteroidota bacterium]
MLRLTAVAIGLLCCGFSLLAGPGKPFIRTINYSQYVSGRENWCIVQNQLGLIYVANENGVLEYDGNQWRLIELPGQAKPLWLDIDSANTIYVAGVNEIGYLAPDSTGSLTYRSLMNLLPPRSPDYGEFWEVRSSPSSGVWFRGFRYLVRWHHGKMTVFDRPAGVDRFDVISFVGDQLFFRLAGRGIYTVTGDSLRLLPGTGSLAGVKVNGYLPSDDGSILIVSRMDGLFRYDGSKVWPVPSPDNGYYKTRFIYDSARLGPGRYVFVTLLGGVVLADGQGRILQIYNESNGLHDNYGLFSFKDREGGLWIGHNNGLSRIFLSQPFTVFDRQSGLHGNLEAMTRVNNRLFIATSQGLFRIDEADTLTPDRFPRAVPIQGLPGIYRSVVPYENGLLIGSSTAAYYWNGQNLRQISSLDIDFILPLPHFPNTILYSDRFIGIGLITRQGGSFTDHGVIQTFPYPISSIRHLNGDLWISTVRHGVFRASESEMAADPAGTLSRAVLSGPVPGLPAGQSIHVFTAGNDVLAGTSEGVFRFEEDRFSAWRLVNERLPAGMNQVRHLHLDSRNRLWMKISDGRRYDVLAIDLTPGAGFPVLQVPFINPSDKNYSDLFSEPDGTVWFVLGEYLLRFDGTNPDRVSMPPEPIIREVVINGREVLTGSFYSGPAPVLPFGDQEIRFRFVSPTYNQIQSVQYRVSMNTGKEPVWSDWTHLPEKEYSNLHEGTYTFRVQSRLAPGSESEVASYTLRILPPWYRTWYAWTLFSLLAIGSIAWIIRWRTLVLKEQKNLLEIQVAEKTVQLLHAEKMASMGQLTAGLGHEINNPLTILQLNTELMRMKTDAHPTLADDKEFNDSLGRIENGIQRIRRIVNKMGQFSKSEDFDRPMPPGEYLDSVADMVRGQFTDVVVDVENQLPVSRRLQGTRLKMILFNVMTNGAEAVREKQKAGGLAGESGVVSLVAGLSGLNRFQFIIRDNGTGIPESNQSKVFEPFFTTKAPGAGTGLGLYETYTMVKQEGGDISLTSIEGQGTTVTITMPVRL